MFSSAGGRSLAARIFIADLQHINIKSHVRTVCRTWLLLCSENHSLGEWFEKRLMSIMME